MADYADIVGGEYGNPHHYGSTIWDVFMPKPASAQEQRDLENNLFAAGYNENTPSPAGVQQTRSPFGRLLQGMGIIGEPELKPLTEYQKMRVSMGGQYRDEQTGQTNRQNLKDVQDKLKAADDYIEKHGEMPPEDFLTGLGGDYRSGLKKELGEREEDVNYARGKRVRDIEASKLNQTYKQQLISESNFRMSQDKTTAQEAAEFRKLTTIANQDMPKFYMKIYQQQMKAALETTEPYARRSAIMQANKTKSLLMASLISAGASEEEALKIAQDPIDPDMAFGTPPPPGTDTRRFPTATSVDEYMQSEYGMGEGYETPKSPYPAESNPNIVTYPGR